MYSFLYRLNAVATFSVSVLVILVGLASVTDFYHKSSPDVSIKLLKVERFRQFPSGPYKGKDEASLLMEVYADLSSVFTWNTKQLFVFICAEYETAEKSTNQVSLWDKIIQSKSDARIELPFHRNKYFFLDHGNSLRGRQINLTMYWNIMSKAGGFQRDKRVFSGFKLPERYMRVQ